MIAKEMIQDYSIREVCVDCKHLYESYEYDYEFDEEVHYFLCDCDDWWGTEMVGKKWTTEEIYSEVCDVIEQLIRLN